MRSQTLLRKSQLLLAAPILPRRALFSCTDYSRLPRNKRPRLDPLSVFSSRFVSSTVPPSQDDSFSSLPESVDNSKEPTESVEITSPEEIDKPKSRRAKVTSSLSKDSEALELPEGLDILWLPDVVREACSDDPATLPADVFEEALNNLLITLHPQNQHRATYATAAGGSIEPTLGLFCPIEGGDYVIDATVRELARHTGAEVLVLDSVQLAAGEWGQFGRAANCLQLPKNPLHFPSTSPSPPSNRNSSMTEDENDSDEDFEFSPPQQMTLTLLAPSSSQGRALLASSPRRNAIPSKAKVFFDAVINTPSPNPDTDEDSSSLARNRPRIVYIRDFPTLGPSSSIWYPHLLSSVQQRRRGPISRPSSAVPNPMTIIFGMTPPLTPPIHSSSSGPSSGLLSLLMSRGATSSQVSSPSKHHNSDWSEGEAAEKAREGRLRNRLKKWEKGNLILHEEFPRLFPTPEGDVGGSHRPEVIVIGGNGMPPPSLLSGGTAVASGSAGPEAILPFFRESILVPNTRSPSQERETRIQRRREINELSMRMGVGAVGGSIESTSAALVLGNLPSNKEPSADEPERMWDRWGSKIEVWRNVRKIADRAVGNVMSARAAGFKVEKVTLDSTVVPWSAVNMAWIANRSVQDKRKLWTKDSSLTKSIQEEAEDEADTKSGTDPVTERVKNDTELDTYEQRLLPCIVDSASMSTSFSQVHLPSHTIDSVRTIVSLPLLHPRAFEQGILKEHGMTGCLLFGPPGTGKTLVVRALAKEAGCRMITISPSDVMDMYVGEGEKLVRAVFSLARRLSPCVVFLDEIDALFGARMSARESGGAIAHRGVITEFMQEMDGLKSSRDDSVIVIGATNRPFDLDDAVLRRLPRRLLVDLPGEKEREEILKILLRDESLAGDIDVQSLAKKTESFSGSDLKHLCVSAALDSVKENVDLPWSSSSKPDVLPLSSTPQDLPAPSSASVDESLSAESPTESTPTVEDDLSVANSQYHPRILHLRNFTKALKEITPSSSESLGSLAELRKWDEEFGEGRRDRKKRQVWGKGRFGFVDEKVEVGKVSGQVETSPPVPPNTR